MGKVNAGNCGNGKMMNFGTEKRESGEFWKWEKGKWKILELTKWRILEMGKVNAGKFVNRKL